MSSRIARQLLVLGIALSVWASVGRPELLAAILAYLGAVLLVGTPALRALQARLSAWQIAALSALLALPGLAFATRSTSVIAEREGLHGLSAYVADRVRLEALPSIAPALVSAEHPQTFFAFAPGAERVHVRLFARGKRLATAALGHGLFRLVYDPRRDGAPYPANGQLAATIEVDGQTFARTLLASTPLAHPRWLALSGERTLAATVSEETDELFVFDRKGLRLRINVEDGPNDCAFLDETRLVVSYRDHHSLQILDLRNSKVTSELRVGARQHRLAISPDHTQIALAMTGTQPGIAFVATIGLNEAATGLVSKQFFPLEATPDWLAFGADASTLIVVTRKPAAILRLRRTSGIYRSDASLPLVRPAVTLARDNTGARLMLAVTDYEPEGKARLGNHFVQDQLLSLDVEAMRIDARWITPQRSERQTKPGDVDRGLSPLGLAMTADDHWLITFAGSSEVWRAPNGLMAPAILDLSDTPLRAPHSCVELADGTRILASPSAGAVGLIAKDASAPVILRLAPSDEQLLLGFRTMLARRVGERGFYEATRSGVACQSCHMHGDTDDALHNLGGKVLVPTLSVRGLFATAPYLRDGSYRTLGSLDELAQTLYRGYLRPQRARGETLEAYMEALPRPRTLAPEGARDLEREQRGFSAFNKASCPTCHTPPAFTNLGTLPMHSLFPDQAAERARGEMLDTPSLLSLSTSAPYLHDGRAATLEDVIAKHNRRNLHGDTAALDTRERADLVHFLGSL